MEPKANLFAELPLYSFTRISLIPHGIIIIILIEHDATDPERDTSDLLPRNVVV
jgi:hypothetical protein